MRDPQPPQPAPPPPELHAARIGAVSTRAAATIGAVAVVVSALLSVLAGVVSANISANAASDTVTQQLTGETDKSRAEFLRGQRQEAYVQILTDHRRFGKLLARQFLAPTVMGDVDRLVRMQDRRLDQTQLLRNDIDVVELLGSPKATRAALALHRRQDAYARAVLGYEVDLVTNRRPSATLYQRRNRAGVELERARRGFVRAARKDLTADE